MTSEDTTLAEICVVACAQAWRGDGAILASPMGLIPSLGARLARLTFEPELLVTDGEAMLVVPCSPSVIGSWGQDDVTDAADRSGHGVTGSRGQDDVVGGADGSGPAGARDTGREVIEGWLPYRDVLRLVATGRRHMMMGAAQLDRYGNQNISAIGDWARPKAQLLGFRGAPGNTINHPVSYWIPRHSPRVFVERVDVVCGIGYDRAAGVAGTSAAGTSAASTSAAGTGVRDHASGGGNDGRAVQVSGAGAPFHEIRFVVTDKAVLDFQTPDHSMRVRSVHPGVSVEEVQALTGFALIIPDDLAVTPMPTQIELDLIRNTLDPAALRDRELA